MALKIDVETPVLMAEVKERLQASKEKGELNFRAQKTLEHMEQFTPLKLKKALELLETLKKLEIPRLRDVHLIKLVDLLPKTENEVKVILQGYAVTVTAENCKKIADAIGEFVE